MMKKFLVDCWNKSFDLYLIMKDAFCIGLDSVYTKTVGSPRIATLEDSIKLTIEKRVSIARYGDGEIKLCRNRDLGFQHADPTLCARLRAILHNDTDGLLVCVPGVFESLDQYMEHDRKHWTKHLAYFRRSWYRYMNRDSQYGEAFVSRFYMPYRDKAIAKRAVELWKQIWDRRDLLIVEGEKSRLGVGNDLFDNAHSIKRILAPNMEAFAYYEEILIEVKKHDKTNLVLLALGPTATVLAADLCLLGYQAIDIGHIDIEYEWMRMGTNHKVPVSNKFVNEAGGGKGVGACLDYEYNVQIVTKIGGEHE